MSWQFRAPRLFEAPKRFWAWGRLDPFFLSVNEGRGPVNFAIGRLFPGSRFTIYLYAFGRSWCSGRRA